MNVGDWVCFRTRNWPKDVRHAGIDPATGERTDLFNHDIRSHGILSLLLDALPRQYTSV